MPRPILVASIIFLGTVGSWTLAYVFSAIQPEAADPGWPLALSVFAGTVLLFPAGLALLSSKILADHLPFFGMIAVAAALNGAFWGGLHFVARKVMYRLVALRIRGRSA
jgi:hypothetical protein